MNMHAAPDDLYADDLDLTVELVQADANFHADTQRVDADSCRQLYMSIIELAVQDYRFLQRMGARKHTSRYDRKKLRQMTEDGDPREFFAGSWFEEVCNYVGVQPDLIRERLHNEDVRFKVA